MTRLPGVTVSVLTYNGARYLDELLTAVEGQRYPGDIDLLVIDSGSTDRTLEIVAAHPDVRLHQIPNPEFGHGRTRNLVAELAIGEFVAYLTHVAVPVDPDWLEALVQPMIDDSRVAAVLGKQIARPSAPPAIKYDIRRTFEHLGPDYGTTMFVADPLLSDVERDAAAFYSDANSAARRSVITGSVPYRDVDYAEDQQFGRDLLDAGFRKAYAPRGAVVHSNDLNFGQFGNRIEEETIALRRVGRAVPPIGVGRAFANALRFSWLDVPLIATDPEYNSGRKLGWLLANPWWQLRKWLAYRRAARTALGGGAQALPMTR